MDNAHAQLLPSDATTQELSELEVEEPRIRALVGLMPNGPRACNLVSLYSECTAEGSSLIRRVTADAEEYPGSLEPECTLVFQMVQIPVPGRPAALAVSRMPGYGDGACVQTELDALQAAGIRHVVCLVPERDFADFYQNPDYFVEARKRFGDRLRCVEVLDYQPPPQDDLFEETVEYAEEALQRGEEVFVHCAAGCGRAGVFSCCVLVRAGMEPLEAVELFRSQRGCGPETTAQVAYVVRYARRLGNRRR